MITKGRAPITYKICREVVEGVRGDQPHRAHTLVYEKVNKKRNMLSILIK